MKVSVNWIRDINKKYQCSADPTPKGIDDLVEKIGAQLGAVEEVINVGEKYQGIVVSKVVKCEKHPNADKLSLCLIDDGGVVKKVKRDAKGLVEVVCGAPNVSAGQLVVWIPPGVTVPSTIDKEPFVLEMREVRGKISNGMIASLKELALGDDHSGILVIDQPAKPGQPFAEVYQLDDFIIDIENKMFTHRPDLFGMLGIAREIAGIQNQVFKSPSWYKERVETPKSKGKGLDLTVKNSLPKLVPRFCAVVIRDVAVVPSPIWLQTYLIRVGIRPINNIVDMTNFYMLESAQPLHAYDYDKLSGGNIETRKAKDGEELQVLGGKIIKLTKDDILITSGGRPIGLGGVMGGAGTEVDNKTKNIILEVANFDMNTIRRTAMTHGLFTDAATRFTKNQSPRQILPVILRAMTDIKSVAGGRQASPVIDDKQSTINNQQSTVRVTADFVNDRLGLKLSVAQIKKILENVEFKVRVKQEKPTTSQKPHFQGATLEMGVPFWRTDIEIPEDIVEEVGRLYGYDHLPLVLPNRDLTPAKLNADLAFKQQIREILSAAGANEVLTYSFVHGSKVDKAGQDLKLAYHIKNALSPDLQYYRLSLTPSLLEKVHPNIKAGHDQFGLFEIGRAHVRGVIDPEKLPTELDRLALAIVDKKSDRSRGAPYYQAKHYVLYLADKLGIGEFISVPLVEADLTEDWRQAAAAYETARSAAIYSGQIFLGLVGEPSASLRTNLKLPAYTSQAELDLVALAQTGSGATYAPLSRFPSLDQDITLKVPAGLDYATVVDFVSNFLGKASQPAGYQGNVGPLDIFQPSTRPEADLAQVDPERSKAVSKGQKPGDKNHKNITLRISMSHPERTLITEEVNKLLDELATEAKISLKADRV